MLWIFPNINIWHLVSLMTSAAVDLLFPPLVTLWPVIHTHKKGLKSYKSHSLEPSALLKKSNIPSCNDQLFLYSEPLHSETVCSPKSLAADWEFLCSSCCRSFIPVCFYLCPRHTGRPNSPVSSFQNATRPSAF